MPRLSIPEMEEMLSRFTEWLNMHATDPDLFVTREMYDEYDDSPTMTLDTRACAPGHTEQHGRRIIEVYANPFHDEGGPNILTGFFEWDDGMRFVPLPGPLLRAGGQFKQVEEPHWILCDMIQEFDTQRQFIVQDGKLVNTP